MERCPNCGASMRTGARFCTACGYRLTAPAGEPATEGDTESPHPTDEPVADAVVTSEPTGNPRWGETTGESEAASVAAIPWWEQAPQGGAAPTRAEDAAASQGTGDEAGGAAEVRPDPTASWSSVARQEAPDPAWTEAVAEGDGQGAAVPPADATEWSPDEASSPEGTSPEGTSPRAEDGETSGSTTDDRAWAVVESAAGEAAAGDEGAADAAVTDGADGAVPLAQDEVLAVSHAQGSYRAVADDDGGRALTEAAAVGDEVGEASGVDLVLEADAPAQGPVEDQEATSYDSVLDGHAAAVTADPVTADPPTESGDLPRDAEGSAGAADKAWLGRSAQDAVADEDAAATLGYEGDAAELGAGELRGADGASLEAAPLLAEESTAEPVDPGAEPPLGMTAVDAMGRAAALVEELSGLLPAIAAAGQRAAAPAAEAVVDDLAAARGEIDSALEGEFERLREALAAAPARRRDIDTMLDLMGRLETVVAMQEAHDRYAEAIDRAVLTLRGGDQG